MNTKTWNFANIIVIKGAIIIIVMLLVAPPNCRAGLKKWWPALEVTQLANNAQLLFIAIQEADILKSNVDQYKKMYQNTKRLKHFQRVEIIDDIRSLSRIVATGRAIAYSSARIDEKYNQIHQAYGDYADMRGNKSARDYHAFSEKYREWAQSNHDSVKGALKAAGLQARQFQSEARAMRKIENQVSAAKGRNKILQASASIAAQEVAQLKKLRQLVMSQIQIQAAQVGGQVDRHSEDDSDLQRALQPRHGLNPDRGGGINMNEPMRSN